MNFPDVELARTGTFDASTGRVTLTSQDFRDMVAAFNDLKGKYGFPLKLGHNNGQPLLKNDGLPAAGWIDNLRIEGDRLVADYVDVPNGVAALLQQKALRTRSIEFFRNVKLAGKRYPIVLTAVALLGEQLPAVDSLSDIAELYAAASLEKPELEGEVVKLTTEHEATKEESELAEIIGELLGALEKAEGKIHGKQGAPALRSLVATTLRELKRVASGQFRKELTTMEVKTLAQLLKLNDDATEADILAAVTKLSATPEPPKPEPKPEESEAFAALKREQEADRKRLLELEQANALSLATTAVDDAIKARKFVPASRDTLVKMAVASPDTFAELVKNTPEIKALSGELGTSGQRDTVVSGAFDESDYEPTAQELAIAEQTGVTRETIIRQKAEDKGVKVPADYGKASTVDVSKLASELAKILESAKAS